MQQPHTVIAKEKTNSALTVELVVPISLMGTTTGDAIALMNLSEHIANSLLQL